MLAVWGSLFEIKSKANCNPVELIGIQWLEKKTVLFK